MDFKVIWHKCLQRNGVSLKRNTFLLIKVKIGHQYDFLDSVCHEWIIELLGTNINSDDSVPWSNCDQR